jgi:hypothetical protein
MKYVRDYEIWNHETHEVQVVRGDELLEAGDGCNGASITFRDMTGKIWKGFYCYSAIDVEQVA